ncbi:hypothetical protein HK097_008040 [Rhizophlyctis rosea]|uniref:Splicing factor U2AF subunit n=1 Tax=Rhizophlyctis rosea TaxID=64517 RepID=A0AAD5X8J1_9FUNG|nr:hypothetical protein HK097_008040 [Rhizophlyctis rosea]
MAQTWMLTAAVTAQKENTGTVTGIVRETGTETGTGIETGTGTANTETVTEATAKGANASATAAGAETEVTGDMTVATETVTGTEGSAAGVVTVIEEKEGAARTEGRSVAVPGAGMGGQGEVQVLKRKLNNWDVAPPGFEGYTAQQVKDSGAFPLPGQPARGGMSAFSFMSGDRAEALRLATAGAAGGASLVRQARRLYVGNIPYGISDEALMAFFNQTMTQLNITTGAGDPVIAAQINHDKNYAFCEFRTPEEATAAMAFDGIQFAGQSLKIRRPKDYQPVGGDSDAPMAIHVPGVVSTNVPDSVNKIFVGGLPIYLNDDQVMELLKSFGELRAFNLVKDAQTGASKGFAFCEYVDPAITDIACQGLNGMELGDKKLVVQRASLGANKIGPGAGMPLILPHTLLTGEGEVIPSNVLMLLNMVTPEELVDQEDYDEIMEDIQEEAAKYGTVKQVKIPRPIPGQEIPGVGKIFVQYNNEEEAGTALKALAGRKFADRTVVTSYWNEDKYLADDF